MLLRAGCRRLPTGAAAELAYTRPGGLETLETRRRLAQAAEKLIQTAPLKIIPGRVE